MFYTERPIVPYLCHETIGSPVSRQRKVSYILHETVNSFVGQLETPYILYGTTDSFVENQTIPYILLGTADSFEDYYMARSFFMEPCMSFRY